MTRSYPIPHGAIKIPVPDTTQQTDSSCGASCLQAICKYYGVGKEDEWEYVHDLGMDPRVGSHPFQIIRTARRYGLITREHWPMSQEQLLRYLRDRKPVMLMIQAWGEQEGGAGYRRSYQDIWIDGHWVVAIGFDRRGVFFEDPSLQAVRGYLRFEELSQRWRDTGPRGKRMREYGLAVWKPGFRRSAYTTRAYRIG
jgi:ABC-type bacteriocin/lantibiotic exporter with double-glycine peptidase domain